MRIYNILSILHQVQISKQMIIMLATPDLTTPDLTNFLESVDLLHVVFGNEGLQWHYLHL